MKVDVFFGACNAETLKKSWMLHVQSQNEKTDDDDDDDEDDDDNLPKPTLSEENPDELIKFTDAGEGFETM